MTSKDTGASTSSGTAVADKIRYAQALAASALLPPVYRRQPANLLYALEYAEMLGMHPLAAVTGVHVIDGKPCASAALIAALVRRAGHRLRLIGDDDAAVAEIVRSDDPTFTFRSEWTRERAERAALLGKGVWQLYPAAMLKARAITEVARDACEDVLVGLHYTPEELGAEEEQLHEGREQVDPAAVGLHVDEERGWLRDWGLRLAGGVGEEVLRSLWEEMLLRHKAGMLSDSGRQSAEFAFTEVARVSAGGPGACAVADVAVAETPAPPASEPEQVASFDSDRGSHASGRTRSRSAPSGGVGAQGLRHAVRVGAGSRPEELT